MQKERTIEFWNDFHEQNGDKEWIVYPTDDLLELMYSQGIAGVSVHGQLRVLEIGCGTSTMARELWKYVQDNKKDCKLHLRATDVSKVCVDVCFSRDKDIPNVFPPGESVTGSQGLQYTTLNILNTPEESECGVWDMILDKACLDTFLFRSRQRGQSKAYSVVIQTALDNIWSLMADDGVYMLLSPRTKLKAVRDFAGFSSVERRAIHSEAKGSIISKPYVPVVGKKQGDETCYMYICKKNRDYSIGEAKAFNENRRNLPDDDAKCRKCGILFASFRKGENIEERGVIVWTREWKNHCIHCKGPVQVSDT